MASKKPHVVPKKTGKQPPQPERQPLQSLLGDEKVTSLLNAETVSEGLADFVSEWKTYNTNAGNDIGQAQSVLQEIEHIRTNANHRIEQLQAQVRQLEASINRHRGSCMAIEKMMLRQK